MTSKWLILAFLCVLSSSVYAVTLNCTVTEDAEFDEDAARDGTETGMFADTIDNTGEQAWLGFDGCVNQIAAGSTINNAILHFYTSSGSDENLQIWQYQNQTWDESEVDGYCPGVYCANAKNKLSPLICTMNGVDAAVWQTSCNLSSAVATELAATNDRVSFVLNNTGDPADYYNVRSKEDSGGIYSAWLYITYTEAAAIGGKTLYINQSHSACSDAYSRADNSITQPWCSPEGAEGEFLCNDTIEFVAGSNSSYELSDEFTISGLSCSGGNNLTVRGYNDNPYEISYTTSCASWTDVSGSFSGQNVWSCAQPGHDSDNIKAYLSNNTMFFTFRDLDDFTNANTAYYRESIYTNGATNTIYVKLSGSRNPNTEDIKLAVRYAAVEITGNTFGDNNTFIIWEDAVFKWGFRNIDLEHGNFIYRNNTCYGGYYCINADGADTAGHGPIAAYNNYMDAGYNMDRWYNTDMKDNGQMENSQIKISNFMGRAILYNNEFTNTHGAIYLDSDDYNEMPDSIIANSTFTNGRGSQIEIEDYGQVTVYGIKITNSMYGVSLAPANCSLAPTPCKLMNSIILVNQSVRESPGVTWEGYGLKFTTLSSHGNMIASNWLLDHNTIYGYDNAIRKTDYADCDGTWKNITVRNTIFKSYTSYVLMTTGLESEGVVYDYNLYYNDPSASYDFYRYNVDCGTVRHATLASAEASAYATATWNDNSLNVNPLIDDWDYNPIPSIDSPVCGAASDGTDIGAIPCESDNTNPVLTFSASGGYDGLGNNSFFFRCNDNNGVANVSLYINGSLNYTTTVSGNETSGHVYWYNQEEYGNYSYYIQCTDTSGNTDNSSLSWKYFVTKPYTVLTLPTNNSNYAATDTINIVATCEQPISGVSCRELYIRRVGSDAYVYGGSNCSGGGDTFYDLSTDTTLTPGSYYLSLGCSNVAGYNSTIHYFTVDTINLTVYINDTNTGLLLEDFSIEIDGVTYNSTGNKTVVQIGSPAYYDIYGYKENYVIIPQEVYVNASAVTVYLQSSSTKVNISVYDEQTNTIINWTTVYIDVIGQANNNYTTTDGTQSIVNIVPGYYEIVYYADGYFKRSYYVTIREGTNETINLYLLNSTEGTRVFHTLYDENSNKVEDITVRLLRFYASSNSYKTVQMAKTNFEGRAQLYVELYDTYYKLQYTDSNGTTYKITNTTYWFDTETEDNIKLGEDIFQSWRTFDDGYYNLSFINSSGTIYARFIYSVTSGVVRTGCLNVQRLTSSGLYDVCNNCTTGSSAVLTCVIDTTIGGQYKAVGYIDTNTANSWYTTAVEWYNAVASTPIPKTDSMLIVALIAGSFIFVGISSLTGSVILFVFALIISSLIGLASGVGMQVIVYLAIVGIIITMIAARSNK